MTPLIRGGYAKHHGLTWENLMNVDVAVRRKIEMKGCNLDRATLPRAPTPSGASEMHWGFFQYVLF